MLSFADGSVTYGYDQSNNLIYAKKDGRENVLKFNEDYTGNPSYLFDFFQVPLPLQMIVDLFMILPFMPH
ncbi:hypothetical protein [Klebsiella quasipneumoniae]|uniref:hypothetical protein n=1 Tax=Klebsiella quasipneumoniae TaxID=1463165 RepID=UPI00388FF458